jgi:hypothetical protein
MAFARPRPGVLAVALISVWSLIATPPVWAQTCPNDGSFQYSVVGTGASTMGPFFSSLVFVYRDLSKTTCPSFSTSGSGFGRTSIIAKTVHAADFIPVIIPSFSLCVWWYVPWSHSKLSV